MIGRINYRPASEIAADFAALRLDDLSGFVMNSDYNVVEKHNERLYELRRDISNLHTHMLDIEHDLDELYSIRKTKEFDAADAVTLKVLNDIFEYQSQFDRLLEKRREICDHDMVEIGHDSHYDYYRCTKCGKEERV